MGTGGPSASSTPTFNVASSSETYVNELSKNIISYSLFTIHYSLSVRRTRFWWLVRESNKCCAFDGSHHRCSPLFAKNSPPDCFLNAKTLSGSIPLMQNLSYKTSLNNVVDFLVTRAGIEPALPAWEAGVLTAWPTSHILTKGSFWAPCPLVHHQGLEPGTPWLRVRCSTNWANGAFFSTWKKVCLPEMFPAQP